VGVKLSRYLLFLGACGGFAQTPPPKTLPDAQGKETFVMVCSMCHSPNAVIGKQGTKQWWQSKVTEMLQEVTDVPDSDVDTIVNYLAKNFPIVKINVNKASAKELETGLDLTAKESEAIVQYREAKGSFKTLDDLKKVPGLDTVKIESKKDSLEF
jgi:competence protein ComEA